MKRIYITYTNVNKLFYVVTFGKVIYKLEMEGMFRMEVLIEQRMCSSCIRSSSEYYEMKLHLRFKFFNDVQSTKKKVLRLMQDKFDTINKVEEIDNGFDIYFRYHTRMSDILSLFKREYIVSERRSRKLVGYDKLTSKNVYKYFQSLTLVGITCGDEIELKGIEYVVKAVNKDGKLVLLSEDGNTKKVVSYSVVEDYFKVLRHKRDERE